MKRLWLLAGLALTQAAVPQTYTNTVFPAITMTASAQTSVPLVFQSAYASGTVQLTGVSLTTATFAVYGCSLTTCTAAQYLPLALQSCSSPGTFATTQTATANACYQVSLAGITSVEYVTSGTFTATSITLTLTGSQNAQMARSASGGGSPGGAAGGDLCGTYPNPQVCSTGGVAFAPSATTDTTNATNITSGTLAAARVASLPTSKITLNGGCQVFSGVNCINVTGLTAAISSSNCPLSETTTGSFCVIYTPTSAGVYLIVPTIVITTVGTGGTIQWEGSANTGAGGSSSFPACSTVSTTSVGTQSASCAFYLYIGANQAIGYKTLFSSVTGTPAYTMTVAVEQIQ